jgi:hypothetical protein
MCKIDIFIKKIKPIEEKKVSKAGPIYRGLVDAIATD